jgi:hypothetical protein
MRKRPPKPPDLEASPRHKEKPDPVNSLVKKLNELTKAHPSFEHFASFEKETRGEVSHRGAAILASANVENALEIALGDVLVGKRTSALFGADCPLGSFRNKILMAHALDIFGEQMFKNLECIRHIRNAFAHAKIPISFASKEVSDVCDVMVFPRLMPPHVLGADKRDHSSLSGLERFRMICEMIAHNLSVRSFHRPKLVDIAKIGTSTRWPYVKAVAYTEPLP